MTQKLIQNVEVLQMSSQELMDYICEQATENPVNRYGCAELL